LKAAGREIFYTPCDVSTAMVLTARQTALAVLQDKNCFPLVCDLATTDDLPEILNPFPVSRALRLVTFFGMIPNFEPEQILPKLELLVRPRDFLLFSANLAPGGDYAAGVKEILPQYDNPLTHDWLMTFLLDLGIERDDGELRFAIEDVPSNGLKRVTVDFYLTRSRRIEIESEAFDFRAGEAIRLFFSYRYTPALVRKLLKQNKLAVIDEWVANFGEEGVFLCRKK
jgi:uncharacterized SAM-dependent methyltransferase